MLQCIWDGILFSIYGMKLERKKKKSDFFVKKEKQKDVSMEAKGQRVNLGLLPGLAGGGGGGGGMYDLYRDGSFKRVVRKAVQPARAGAAQLWTSVAAFVQFLYSKRRHHSIHAWQAGASSLPSPHAIFVDESVNHGVNQLNLEVGAIHKSQYLTRNQMRSYSGA
jgi:hypothetical protein